MPAQPLVEEISSILVVEDNADQREALCEILEDEGFTILACASAKEAACSRGRGLAPPAAATGKPILSQGDYRIRSVPCWNVRSVATATARDRCRSPWW